MTAADVKIIYKRFKLLTNNNECWKHAYGGTVVVQQKNELHVFNINEIIFKIKFVIKKYMYRTSRYTIGEFNEITF